jgi:hypothetical protein
MTNVGRVPDDPNGSGKVHTARTRNTDFTDLLAGMSTSH